MINENYRIREKPGTYIFYARDAARHERKRCYSVAADCWRLAELRAVNPISREFAKARLAFCIRAMEAPLRKMAVVS